MTYSKSLKICESCHELSDYNLTDGQLICLVCGESMLRKEVEVPATGIADTKNAIPEQPVELSIMATVVTKPATEPLPPLTLDEMRSNIAKAQKAFETLESRLNKLRIQKAESISKGENAKIVELALQDAEISLKLDEAYELWQNAKKNYEYTAIDFENKVIAEDLLKKYEATVDSRAVKGNEMLNSLQQLNDLIGRASELASEFMQTQITGMDNSERLIREFRRLNVYRVGNTEIPVIRSDNYGNIRPIRESLLKETGLLESNLAIIESTILCLRKSCSFDSLHQG